MAAVDAGAGVDDVAAEYAAGVGDDDWVELDQEELDLQDYQIQACSSRLNTFLVPWVCLTLEVEAGVTSVYLCEVKEEGREEDHNVRPFCDSSFSYFKNTF